MKKLLVLLVILTSLQAYAQVAEIGISLRPAGSFKVKSKEVRGFATMKPDHSVEASNIVVGVKNIETGISLRDQHTKKHLEVDKFPDVTLVSAQGRNGKGTGIIKIKGIQHKIDGTYSVAGKILTAKFPLKLSDYKIEGIKYMGVGVADDVEVEVSVPMK